MSTILSASQVLLAKTWLKAVSDGEAKVVKRMLETSRTIINYQNGLGCTALHLAAENEDVQIVSILVDHSAATNITDKMGWTPLNLACSKGHLEIVNILLAHGANIHLANQFGATPHHSAASSGCFEIVLRLVANEGASLIDACNFLGESPLMIATTNKCFKIAQLLIDAGANLTLRNNARQRIEDLADVNSPIQGILREATTHIRLHAKDALDKNQCDEAIALYNRIISPFGWPHVMDLVHRAMAFIVSGNTTAAFKDATASFRLGKADVFSTLGDMLLEIDRVEDAKLVYEVGKDLDYSCQMALERIHEEEDVSLLFSEPMDNIQCKLSQDDELHDWLENDPNFVDALHNVHYFGYAVYFEDARLKKALAVLKMHHAIESLLVGDKSSGWKDAKACYILGKTDVYATMADMLQLLGLVDDATIAYSKAVEANPSDMSCFVGLARNILGKMDISTMNPRQANDDEPSEQPLSKDMRARIEPMDMPVEHVQGFRQY
ncbi:Aste57867_11726 [Aphanomyces stellatus]|uniref:Aste57867_11726 protein n=1 Tax=Aphanomyces stellatus TaxID=120398 RepID=A0A485KVP1_9STRA|nr:hypothetical protein As57867_011682 [Aphanomyces stellatus]VFT88583.1 Aste57867_11726 [Aphanomyces stellatus]